MSLYYGVKRCDHGYFGRVYHFDVSGNKEIEDYRSGEVFNSKEEAIDDAGEWLEDHDREASADGTW